MNGVQTMKKAMQTLRDFTPEMTLDRPVWTSGLRALAGGLALILCVVVNGDAVAQASLEKSCENFDPDALERRIKACSQLITADPANADAYVNRGDAYFQKNQVDRSLKDFGQALKLDPENQGALEVRGLIYIEIAKYDLAIKDFGAIIRLDPDYAESYGNRATAYLKLGKPEKALADAKRAVELTPDYWGHRLGLGETYESLAAATYRKALQFDPTCKECKGRLKRLGAAQ